MVIPDQVRPAGLEFVSVQIGNEFAFCFAFGVIASCDAHPAKHTKHNKVITRYDMTVPEAALLSGWPLPGVAVDLSYALAFY
jgi:hypothetical protein